MQKNLKFGELRNYISVIDKISICNKETLDYENFNNVKEVPSKYDDLYVYGIGITESEFGNLIVLEECLEIMLSRNPKNG